MNIVWEELVETIFWNDFFEPSLEVFIWSISYLGHSELEGLMTYTATHQQG